MSSGGWRQQGPIQPLWGESETGTWPTWSSVAAAASAGDEASGDGDQPPAELQVPRPYFRNPGRETNQWGDWSWNQQWSQGPWGNGTWQGDDWSRWSPWWRSNGGSQKGDFSDPPAWGGWASYRLWKKSLRRWDANTDVPTWRRFEKLCKQLDWDLQGKFEHVPEPPRSVES